LLLFSVHPEPNGRKVDKILTLKKVKELVEHRCTVDCTPTCVASDCAAVCGGMGGFAAFLALLDGSYAQAAASALVALLLCPFAAPMLLSLAGSALIVTAAALFAWLF